MAASSLGFVTLRCKIAGSFLVLATVTLIGLATALGYETDCAPAPALPAGATAMKAIVNRCYGPPAVLRLENIAKPIPAEHEILVKVRAAAVNPLDWHRMRGEPYLMRRNAGIGAPKNERMGVDFAGIVEAVGKSATKFKPGDEVFGLRTGAFAEYVTTREDYVVLKPANATFEEAAAIPIAAVTALEALREHGRVQAGQKVLINGASGGVGTYAVQIAKSFGAEVTGVCSTRNVSMVRSLGADQVIDYTRENFTTGGERYDMIFDTVGNHPLLAYRDVLQPQGILVTIGGGSPGHDRWIGAMFRPMKIRMAQPFTSQQLMTFRSDPGQQDLAFLANLMQEGKLRSVIDRRFTLSEAAAAIGYVETGRARGKVVIVPE
jgi:NADPH:quinone reductase-like Zn-dependent oxidoreductase